MTLEDAGEDQIAQRQRRIERLYRLAASLVNHKFGTISIGPITPSPLMGEGRGGGDAAEDRSVVKKEPTEGAYRRARILRREMTEAEKRLWQMLRLRQTEGYRFRRQVPIGRFIADFVCHAARLIVEIDGGQHDLSSEEEASRTRFLESEGYRVLRFWNNEVLDNPEGVHSVIAENFRQVTPTQTLRHQGGGQEGFR